MRSLRACWRFDIALAILSVSVALVRSWSRARAKRGEARRVRLQAWAEQQGEKAVGEQQRQRFKEEDSAADMR